MMMFLGLFGSSKDDDDEIERIAKRLNASPSPQDVENQIDRLQGALDVLTAEVSTNAVGTPPDADPVSKAELLERAVKDGRISLESGVPEHSADNDPEAIIRAAENVAHTINPDSRVSDRLLGEITGSRGASVSQLKQTLSEVIDRLDEYERAENALDRIPDADSLPEIAESYESHSNKKRRQSMDNDQLVSATEELLNTVDVEVTTSGDLYWRVREATRKLREQTDNPEIADDREGRVNRGKSIPERHRSFLDTNNTGEIEDVVNRARDTVSPRSREARKLFNALEVGKADNTVDALQTAARRLDETATARSMLESVEPDDVTSLAAELDHELTDHDGPIAERLQSRVKELESRIDRVDKSNHVLLLAAQEELTFYRRELIDAVTGSDYVLDSENMDDDGMETQKDMFEQMGSLRERREQINTEYIEQRSDHNHSIPLYFLSLVDSNLETADELLVSGKLNRAAGVLTVSEAVLKHIEGLYEQNQYSVMLRSLRG